MNEVCMCIDCWIHFCAIFVNTVVLHNFSQMSVLISHIKKWMMCQPEAQKFLHKTLYAIQAFVK